MLRISCSIVNSTLPVSRSTMSSKRYWQRSLSSVIRSSRATEAILAAVALLGDQVELLQFLVRAAEILDINLDVVPVIVRQFLVGLAEDEFLLIAYRNMRRLAAAIALNLGVGAEDLLVEAGDASRRPRGDGELDIGNAKFDLAEALLVWLVDVQLVAPRAGRLDVVVVLLEPEFGVLQLLLSPLKPLHPRLAVGRDDTDVAPQHQRLAARQMKLALPD